MSEQRNIRMSDLDADDGWISAPAPVEYHQFGTWCLRGGGHIDVDHECRRKGLDLLVRFDPNDFVSREELAEVLDKLHAMFADESMYTGRKTERVPYEPEEDL